ncbi:MAG: XRE family transcriptional regulator [Proteobacteria bacterium]|nr:XRE family transcriptional regulator [Pseudomonadota bacterium]
MGGTLEEMLQTLSPAQRSAVEKRAAILIAEELSLGDLRKAMHLTQADLARRLNKGQDAVSRIEKREDLLISTLDSYVKSLGGELELVVRFKDREPIRLKSAAFAKHRAVAKKPKVNRSRAIA